MASLASHFNNQPPTVASTIRKVTTNRLLILVEHSGKWVVCQKHPYATDNDGNPGYRWAFLNKHSAFCGSYLFSTPHTQWEAQQYLAPPPGTPDPVSRSFLAHVSETNNQTYGRFVKAFKRRCRSINDVPPEFDTPIRPQRTEPADPREQSPFSDV